MSKPGNRNLRDSIAKFTVSEVGKQNLRRRMRANTQAKVRLERKEKLDGNGAGG